MMTTSRGNTTRIPWLFCLNTRSESETRRSNTGRHFSRTTSIKITALFWRTNTYISVTVFLFATVFSCLLRIWILRCERHNYSDFKDGTFLIYVLEFTGKMHPEGKFYLIRTRRRACPEGVTKLLITDIFMAPLLLRGRHISHTTFRGTRGPTTRRRHEANMRSNESI